VGDRLVNLPHSGDIVPAASAAVAADWFILGVRRQQGTMLYVHGGGRCPSPEQSRVAQVTLSKFLMVKYQTMAGAATFVVVENWFEELKRLVSSK